MRELLEEAAEVLRRGQADEQADLAERITAALAKPEPDADDVLQRVRDMNEIGMGAEERWAWRLTDSEAAALIESYGRRVPRAFVEEILDKAWNCLTDRPEGMVLQTVADKYGVQVEE